MDQPKLVTEPKIIGDPHLDLNLVGVRGWLLFFCVVIGIVQPIHNVADAFDADSLFVWILTITLSGLSIATAHSIFTTKERTFTLLRWFFASYACLAGLGLLATLLEQSNHRGLTGSLQSVLFLLTWFSYFRKSIRVRSTFGRNL